MLARRVRESLGTLGMLDRGGRLALSVGRGSNPS